MSGIELRDGTLLVDREPNDLDDLAIRFTRILDDPDAEHYRRVRSAGEDDEA